MLNYVSKFYNNHYDNNSLSRTESLRVYITLREEGIGGNCL